MPRHLLSRIATAALFAAIPVSAQAADLKILTTPALTEVWQELGPKFEAAGHKLTIVYASSGAVAKRVTEGETADLLVSTPAGIDGLIKAGKVTDGTNTSIASSGMGVAVLKGAPKPDISNPEAFKRALLAAKAVAYTDPASGGASGVHMAKVLERLGIANEVNAKAKLGRGVPAGSFVVKGEADIAIQQIPELLGVAGVEIVGPLPGDLQNVTTFAAGIPAGSANADAAKALIRFLQTPESAAAIKKHGLDPVPAAVPPKAS
jgi:molybdate transport system substrate-binding protein